MSEIPVISARDARGLLLLGQGLLGDPARRATPAAVYKQIERMGYVQVDTINIVCRAHHHIVHSRFDDYQPRLLTKLLEKDRRLFEHWTHDASIIPTTWLPNWRVRFNRFFDKWSHHPWWKTRLGDDPEGLLEYVFESVRDHGPMMSKDFEHERPDGETGTWWGWKPQKAALETLWRMGRLLIRGRVNFHKVYDVAERIFPDLNDQSMLGEEEHVEWACCMALDRLTIATPAEIREFLNAVSNPTATQWCRDAVNRDDLVEVMVEPVEGKPYRAYALPDWKKRLSRAGDAPDRMRLLSPFDPVIRDRKRLERLFGFDYRFEAFVPAAKRQYGYYVLPILEGESFVGRLDAKLHRDRSELEVKGLWWEPGVKVTKKRRAMLDDALERFVRFLGADRFTSPTAAESRTRRSGG